ncbi:hypothetical protein ACQP06_17470 [Nocardia sp. CA-136227]|uniref:hypothetical protein n=1 Tax=Nocardia sp. CA-136227 TaxID=3239979 RepID=UPI003D99DFB4
MTASTGRTTPAWSWTSTVLALITRMPGSPFLSILMTGGGYAARGNNGYIARVNSAGSLQWVAPMFDANPFIGVHYEGMTAVLTNNWRNHLRLDLTHPALR